jgi:hypothetical protein
MAENAIKNGEIITQLGGSPINNSLRWKYLMALAKEQNPGMNQDNPDQP